MVNPNSLLSLAVNFNNVTQPGCVTNLGLPCGRLVLMLFILISVSSNNNPDSQQNLHCRNYIFFSFFSSIFRVYYFISINIK